MARIRSIKPEFWTDDTITECSLSARLLFIGLWNFADDAGNLDRSAKQIKARVFPVDNIDCEPLIQELIAHGLLIEYSVSGKKYLHIPRFAKHQVINRPSKPQVPGPEGSLTTQVVLTEPSVSTHSGKERKGKERKGESADAPPPFDPSTVNGLNLEAWALWVEHRKAIKKPIRPHSLADAAEELAKLGDRQLAEVKRARANGWQGLHPEVPRVAQFPVTEPRRAREFPG